MNKVHVMIVGEQTENITRIMEFKNDHENLDVSIAHNAETAISLFQQQDYDIVLFGALLPEADAKKLKRLFRFQDEEVMLVEIAGADALEVLEDTLHKRKRHHKPVYDFTDDALKDAMWNIHLS
jgi:DNA-binding response OmpR family regulator